MREEDLSVEQIRDMLRLIPNGVVIAPGDLTEIYKQDD